MFFKKAWLTTLFYLSSLYQGAADFTHATKNKFNIYVATYLYKNKDKNPLNKDYTIPRFDTKTAETSANRDTLEYYNSTPSISIPLGGGSHVNISAMLFNPLTESSHNTLSELYNNVARIVIKNKDYDRKVYFQNINKTFVKEKPAYEFSAVTYKQLDGMLDSIKKIYQDALTNNQSAWVSTNMIDYTKYNDSKIYTTQESEHPAYKAYFEQQKPHFAPYVQKIIIKKPHSILLHGDLEGDIQSLMGNLKHYYDQKIIDNNFKLADGYMLFFLGDYVDSGAHGIEVLYTIMRLKAANPESCFLIRGNHEVQSVNKTYGFKDELIAKLGSEQEVTIHEKINTFYNYLPVAIFLGNQEKNEWIQLCHGGIEQNHYPQIFNEPHYTYELITHFYEQTFYESSVEWVNYFKNQYGSEYAKYIQESESINNRNALKNALYNLLSKIHSHFKPTPYKQIMQIEKLNLPKPCLENISKANLNSLRDNSLGNGISTYMMMQPTNCGYLWGDFMIEHNSLDQTVFEDGGIGGRSSIGYLGMQLWRLIICNLTTTETEKKIDGANIFAIIRAHQHSPEVLKLMKEQKPRGALLLWNIENKSNYWQHQLYPGSVVTLNKCPNTGNPSRDLGVRYDTFAKLHVSTKPIKEWKLDVFSTPIDSLEMAGNYESQD